MTEVEQVVSRARRGRALFGAAIAALCVLLISGVMFAIVVNFQQGGDITQVERSACAKSPASRECQRVRRETDKARTIRDTCIAFWKVGYACPAPGSGVTVPTGGGDASQPASAGQPPAPALAGNRGGAQPPDEATKLPGDGQPPAAAPPASQPVFDPPPASPAPSQPPQPAADPPEPPGLLTPALTRVCSIADRLAHLC